MGISLPQLIVPDGSPTKIEQRQGDAIQGIKSRGVQQASAPHPQFGFERRSPIGK